jgi:hypothetical protein
MSDMTPEEIRKLPMRQDLPYNGLTPEQVVAIGLDPSEVEAARLSSNEWAAQLAAQQATQQAEAALQEAAMLATAAQEAVTNGQTPAEVAEILLNNGQSLAHQMFVAAWRQEEAEEAALEEADDLAMMNAEEYALRAEERSWEQRAQLEDEVQALHNQLGQTLLDQVKGHLRDYVQSTPGAHENIADVEARVKQIVLDQQDVPEDAAGQQRLIAQAIRDVSLREGLTEQFTAQVEAEWRGQEHRRKSEAFTTRRSDDRSLHQRAADEAAWKEKRLDELSTQYTAEQVEVLRELPPSGAEIAAAERAKFEARQQRDDSAARNAAGIAERGRATASGDRGLAITDEKRAYRDAMKRAEEKAMYGEFAPGVKSGYGPTHEVTVEGGKPRGVDTPIDEFGGAFPGYTRG